MSYPWPRAASVPILTWDDDGEDVAEGDIYVAGPGQNARIRRRLFAFFRATFEDDGWVLYFVDWQATPRPLFCARRVGMGPGDLKLGEPIWIPA